MRQRGGEIGDGEREKKRERERERERELEKGIMTHSHVLLKTVWASLIGPLAEALYC